eukprot:CCRYP_018703-RC/>CCRYP_018703-RC protein AED:0.49 eAED:0.49 QI:0/-1/0/1/-1/0/1/0/7
MSPSLVN